MQFNCRMRLEIEVLCTVEAETLDEAIDLFDTNQGDWNPAQAETINWERCGTTMVDDESREFPCEPKKRLTLPRPIG